MTRTMHGRICRGALIVSLLALLVTGPVTQAAGAPGQQTGAATVQQPRDIRFDFRGADIRAVVNFMAGLSGLIPLVSDQAIGQVTVSTPQLLTLDEAFRVLSAVLDLQELTLYRDDMFLRVIPKGLSAQKPLDVLFGSDPALVPADDRMLTQVVPIERAEAPMVLTTIQPLISSSGSAIVSREANTLLITDTGNNIRRLLTLIDNLDTDRTDANTEQTKVYDVRYMKAEDMATALESVFTAGLGQEPARIMPVATVNALIITAELGRHPEIAKTIRRLDRRRPQVLIEVRIVEGTVRDETATGVNLLEWLFRSTSGLSTVSFGSNVADPFITYTLDSNDVDLVLTAAASDDKINILSAPSILTADNQPARITVAQEEPILQSVTDLSTTATLPRTVASFIYRDVGIEMSVTPRINVDRDVALDVTFLITSLLGNVDLPGGTFAPRIGKREANTSVTVMDGSTLVIGGLIKDDYRDQRSKVPLLGDIPLLGRAFSNVRQVKEQTELLLFVTPKVAGSDEEGRLLTSDKMNTELDILQLEIEKQRQKREQRQAERRQRRSGDVGGAGER